MTTLADLYAAYMGDDEGRRPSGWRCSGLGGCLRQQLLLRDPEKPLAKLTMKRRRMFRHRTIVHNDHVESYRPVAVAIELDVSEALPGVAKGRLDALLHMDCPCGEWTTPSVNARLGALVTAAVNGGVSDRNLDEINEHRLTLVDTKTAHPNLVNYGDTLPKHEHCMQVGGYALALELVGVFLARAMVDYIPVGSQAEGMEYVVDRLPEYMEAARSEWNALDEWWEVYPSELPPVMPLEIVVANRGTALMLRQAWQCGYCDYPGMDICQPLVTVYKNGDTFAARDSADQPWDLVSTARLRKIGVRPERASELIRLHERALEIL